MVRDAERVIRRRRRRQRLILETDCFPPVADLDEQPSLASLLLDPASPEAELIALQVAQQVVLADASYDRGAQILEGLVDGRTTREIAARIRVSPAYASMLAQRAKSAVRLAAGGVSQ